MVYLFPLFWMSTEYKWEIYIRGNPNSQSTYENMFNFTNNR